MRKSPFFKNLLLLVAVCGLIGGPIWYAVNAAQEDGDVDSLKWTAEETDLRITVTERGTLESQKTVNGVCEVEGYDNKIIFIVEEGSTVKKGDVVVRFDSSQIDKEIAEEKLEVQQAKGTVATKLQEVALEKTKGESEIAAAELALELADLDLEKYRDGDYLVELNDLQGKIALARVELEKATEALENTKVLVKKGFREPEQIRTALQTVESTKFSLERDERTLDVLKKYDYKRKLTEFKANAIEAKRKLNREIANADANNKKAENEYKSAQAELKLQEEDLAEAELQKARCEIKAAQTGVVAYANEDWWSESRRIREGGTVYERQVVFFIPDMSLMQLEVKVHESEVKRIATGQKAIIRVDAFANQTFTGTVKSVAQLSKSDRFFGGGVKEYPTVIVLDETPSVPLRPGMTAEVEILVDNLSDVVAVPVQAIAEHRRKRFVYVLNDEGVERREVEIGQTNNRLIEVTTGLKASEVVVLDARSRAAEEFADDEGMEDSEELLKLEQEAESAADKKPEDDEADATDDESAEEKTPDESEPAVEKVDSAVDAADDGPSASEVSPAEEATGDVDSNTKAEGEEAVEGPQASILKQQIGVAEIAKVSAIDLNGRISGAFHDGILSCVA
ncbi:efflux RND transporter periplasmic adaptor subunit [Fuerstiella marisgermanici]|uniref:Cation efflux system protein CzcB n=1 Tax=Fuerstiella marisgermanici TaxID=1891926 RepID=A0A1P8WNJ4_9PLAN|nr:efflux RND transporter periplasmic adaptor subunit [Fuerstiella marisgermanici]APZ95634.1 Cation efflux system protein CzcB [Fuerstiella marisgermanici]